MAGSLAVEVMFLDGAPSAGTEVTLAGVLNRVGVTMATTSGPSSTALFDDLPAGAYLVKLSSLDHQLVEPPPPLIARVGDGLTTTVVATMDLIAGGPMETGAIRGVVASTTGAPIECATVALDGLRGLTNGLGEFGYGAVPAGDHRLVASAPGFVPVVLEVRLIGGQTVELRPVLEPAFATPGVTAAAAAGGATSPALPLLALAVAGTSLVFIATRY